MLRRLFHRRSTSDAPLGREFRVGDVLEQRFEIEQLRLGFMGVVYIAYDRQRRGRVVLKTFQNKFLWDDEAIDLFRAEAELWMRLGSHPNIVRAYDLRTFLGKPHVVAEYVHGGSLRALVGHLSLQEALDYAIQICWGMTYAVEQVAMMHCDLKPDNIMVTLDGQIKVTDFGLARVLPIWQWSEQMRTRRMPAKLRTTMNKALGGTLPYMAPEMLERVAAPGTWSDIYAFGVMLFELLTGRLPFDSMRDESLIRMHIEQPPPSPRKLKPHLPEELADVVQHCMAKRPGDRFQSFRDVEQALQSVRAALFGKPLTVVWAADAHPDRDRWTERGMMHMDLGEYSEALTSFRQAVALDQSRPEGWLHLARARLKLWQYNEALHAIDEGLARAASRHDFGQLYLLRGETLAAMLRSREAAEAFDKGLSYTPNAPALWREKGALLLRMNQPREALSSLRKALHFDALDAHAWQLSGDAHRALQNVKQAHRAYGEALKLNPRSAEGWARYGHCQLDLGRAKEALRSFEAALKLDENLYEAAEGARKARQLLRN
jgi:tetratricopeptide (TPR) repeat protein